MPLTDEPLSLTAPCKITVNFVIPSFNGSVESRFAKCTVKKARPVMHLADLHSAKPLKIPLVVENHSQLPTVFY